MTSDECDVRDKRYQGSMDSIWSVAKQWLSFFLHRYNKVLEDNFETFLAIDFLNYENNLSWMKFEASDFCSRRDHLRNCFERFVDLQFNSTLGRLETRERNTVTEKTRLILCSHLILDRPISDRRQHIQTWPCPRINGDAARFPSSIIIVFSSWMLERHRLRLRSNDCTFQDWDRMHRWWMFHVWREEYAAI